MIIYRLKILAKNQNETNKVINEIFYSNIQKVITEF